MATIRFLGAFKCSRCYADGTLNNYGTYLSAEVNFQSDTPSTYTISYKKASDASWTALPRSDVRYWFNDVVVSSSAILNTDYAYEIKITVENDTETLVQTAFVSTAFVLLDFNASGKGLAFGKVSENPNAIEFGAEIYDRFGTRILNGLAFYEAGGSTDPDTATEEMFLASIPELGGFCFVRQFFFASKTGQANRTQIAFPYASVNSAGVLTGESRSNFRRHYVNGFGWSAWIEEPVVIESGSSGIWKWKKFSDNTCEFFGKIPVTSADVSLALGGWFRGANLYEATAYEYPLQMTEAPALSMMFQTRNGLAALLWAFSADATTAQRYLPQSYLIRPTTATGIYGNINIIGKGKV